MNKTERTQRPRLRVTLDDLIGSGKSMLGEGPLPIEYGQIENTHEAIDAATPTAPPIDLRIYIVWDVETNLLDLPRVLEHMRETGAAMVTKVERVQR
jgi:hypothetical protein